MRAYIQHTAYLQHSYSGQMGGCWGSMWVSGISAFAVFALPPFMLDSCLMMQKKRMTAHVFFWDLSTATVATACAGYGMVS
ncbi:hypothetical protein F4825DRAFT_416968 [Nemania diffusa]|nr:hypothetical protein F4825DRAFT_416968 [Nemania diffusa]